MGDLSAQLVVFLLGVATLTGTALYTDLKWRRIPNKLTLPLFIAGLIYQVIFAQLSGLGDGLLGFAVGFGSLFLLWLIGGGGGGDVKLMGALSVWLGFKMTLWVLIGSTLFVLVSTMLIILWSVLTKGAYKTKDKYVATGKPVKRKDKRVRETNEQKAERRIMAYALPVSVATWVMLLVKWPPV